VAATSTMLASASGAFVAMAYMWALYGKPDISMAANGMLAGLVAITAPCAFVNSVSAVIIGGVAAVLLCWGVFFVERKLKLDAPVGAIAVHGLNGAWGLLSVGLFADGSYGEGLTGVAGGVKGLFYGDGGQLLAQCIAVCANVIYVGLAMFLYFKIAEKFVPMRANPEWEMEGLDQHEVAVTAYPDFSLNKTHR
jgi:Amt family ammonium transporter